MRKRFDNIMRLMRSVRRAVALLVSVSVLSASPSIIRADTAVAPQKPKSSMALPGEKCRVDPLPEWKEPERWAWACICEGKFVDFNERLGERLDLNNLYKWSYDNWWSEEYSWADGRRTLSSRFLRTILLYEPFRNVIPQVGVKIIGAYFKEKIDLSYASIEQPLALDNSLFKDSVEMPHLTTSKFVSFIGSRFEGELNMNTVSIGGSLFMRKKAKFKKDVDLTSAKIGGLLYMDRSSFDGKLYMYAALIGGSLHMQEAEYKSEVNLGGLRVGGQLVMDSSKFKKKVAMDSVTIDYNLLMNNSKFNDLDIRGLRVSEQLAMVASEFNGKLRIDSSSIGTTLFLRSAKFDKPTRLTFLRVGSNLDAKGAVLRGLNLRGTRIGGELQIGHRCKQGKVSCKKEEMEEMQWKSYKDEKGKIRNPELSLQNVRVGTLQDTDNSWPDKLERKFGGFKYQRLGGFTMNEKETHYERSSEWFINWLGKDKPYSPQPYQHLASVLRAAGYSWKADYILYAGRAREHSEREMSCIEWLFLWLLWLFIGYGYGLWNFVALAWVLGFTMIGMTFLRRKKDIDKFLLLLKKKITQRGNSIGSLLGQARSWKKIAGLDLGFWYSLDMLLPVIRLREEHYYDVDLEGWVQYYFYIHKMVGYLLIFFVIAGLTGLTK